MSGEDRLSRQGRQQRTIYLSVAEAMACHTRAVVRRAQIALQLAVHGLAQDAVVESEGERSPGRRCVLCGRVGDGLGTGRGAGPIQPADRCVLASIDNSTQTSRAAPKL